MCLTASSLYVLVPHVSPVICGLLKVSYQSINKALLMELLGVEDGETVWGWRSSVLCVCLCGIGCSGRLL